MKELHSIFIDWTEALVVIENTVMVSTDDKIFLFAGVVIYTNGEGGPKNSFAYVMTRGKSGPARDRMFIFRQ